MSIPQQLPGQLQSVPTLTTLPQPVLNGGAPPTQQLVIQQSTQPGLNTVQPITIIRNAIPAQEPSSTANTDGTASTNQQEKANKIIAEAIAKAQKSGNTAIPKVIQPPELPATLVEMDSLEPTPEGKKSKKKRRYPPKKDKDNQDKDKEKTPKSKKKKKDKTPKEPKEETMDYTLDNSEETSVGVMANCSTGVNSDDLEDSRLEIDESVEEKPKKKKKKKKVAKIEPSDSAPKSEKKRPKK